MVTSADIEVDVAGHVVQDNVATSGGYGGSKNSAARVSE
jgi:hypothetical protein